MAFTDELRQAANPIWSAQHEHPFVRGIGKGSLDPELLYWDTLADGLH
jgi:thiaminase (transcriptional activator TenA)